MCEAKDKQEEKFAGITFLVNPPDDVWQQFLQLVNEEQGWLTFTDDYRCWRETFGDDFQWMVAVDSSTQRLLGSLALARHANMDMVNIGYYVVVKSHQSTGLGSEIWRRSFENPRFQHVNTALVAAPAMSEKYAARKGLDKFSTGAIVHADVRVGDCYPENLEVPQDLKILDWQEALGSVGLRAIADYDMAANGGLDREKYVGVWLSSPTCVACKVGVDVHGKVVGFVGLRKGITKHLAVTPLYADTPEIAGALLRRAIEAVPDFKECGKLHVFAPNDNKYAHKLYVKLTVGTIVAGVTMPTQFTEKPLPYTADKVFGAFELGMFTG